ncbi:MAG: cupin domain-containing protein, partial [Alphaproteobacteria bacterium]|nr:cupin domain-containing protein [Alphaproteobacteria bacterium]
AHLKQRIAIVREGEPLTDSLQIAAETGWFEPMLYDLLCQGVSVVVNDVPITDDIANAVGGHAGLSPDWVTQQNLYITPGRNQGFDPHCDPHVVVVIHLYGRKEWTIYDKVLDNPVYDSETNTIADKSDPPGVRGTLVVEPGDGFVIPRGRFHSALALSPAAVHMAVGVAGARAVDHVWAMAEEAVRDPVMRADMTPDGALQAARRFVAEFPFRPLDLPRFRRAQWSAPEPDSDFSFKDVLDALPSG